MQKFLVALILSLAFVAVFAQQPPAAYVSRCQSIVSTTRPQVFTGRTCPGVRLRLLDPVGNFVCCAEPSSTQRESYTNYLQWCTSGSSNSQIAKAFINRCPSLQTSRNGNGLGALLERNLDWGKDRLVCCYTSAADRLAAATIDGVSSAARSAANTAVAVGNGIADGVSSTVTAGRDGLRAAGRAASNAYDWAAKGITDTYNSAAKSLNDVAARSRAYHNALANFQRECRAFNGRGSEAVDSYFARVPDNRVVCRDGQSPRNFFKAIEGRRMCCPREARRA